MDNKLEIGDIAPDFSLVATDGMIYTLKQFRGARAILIFFTCNHCPYVKGSMQHLKNMYEIFYPRGVEFIGINSNSDLIYQEDSYEEMVLSSQELNLPWPYLHDVTQSVALSFGAVCTPHFFLFNQNKALIYQGRSLDNPMEPEKSTSDDLTKALEEILDSVPISNPETKPIGCSIKWAPENAPEAREGCALV